MQVTLSVKISSYASSCIRKLIDSIKEVIEFNQSEVRTEVQFHNWHTFCRYQLMGVNTLYETILDHPINLECSSSVITLITNVQYSDDTFTIEYQTVSQWLERLFHVPGLTFRPTVFNKINLVRATNLSEKTINRVLRQCADFTIKSHLSYLDVSISAPGLGDNLILMPSENGLRLVSYDNNHTDENAMINKKKRKGNKPEIDLPENFCEIDDGNQLPNAAPRPESVPRETVDELIQAIMNNMAQLSHQNLQQFQQMLNQQQAPPQLPTDPPGQAVGGVEDDPQLVDHDQPLPDAPASGTAQPPPLRQQSSGSGRSQQNHDDTENGGGGFGLFD